MEPEDFKAPVGEGCVSFTPWREPRRVIRVRHSWVWVYCRTYCTHYRAMAIVPWMIRWEVSEGEVLDLMREWLRCSRCGNKGSSLRVPGSSDELVVFPVDKNHLYQRPEE